MRLLLDARTGDTTRPALSLYTALRTPSAEALLVTRAAHPRRPTIPGAPR